jgi:predicted nucleic acid-binding protein
LVTYADSSFLVSLYIADGNTTSANKFIHENPQSICLTNFSKSEVHHAIRMLVFRGNIPHDVMTRGLLYFEHDQQEGLYTSIPFNAEDLFQKAAQLSNRHALEFGVRYLDMLHIASALLINAKRFLTFDARQGKLAKAVGLEVRP